MGLPFISKTKSPVFNFNSWKGILFILPILGSSLAIPLTKIIEENKIIESKKLAAGPAETVKALDIIDALLK